VQGNALDYSDARIFHIISKGQNIMSSYADKLPEVDRWAVVHYIRALQNGEANNIIRTAQNSSVDAASPSYTALEEKTNE
jgi:mono/diheme cytochrome c family protein